MPQVDITLIFIIVQSISLLVIGGYICYLFFLFPVISYTKLFLKVLVRTLTLVKIINFRLKMSSNYIYLKNLKF